MGTSSSAILAYGYDLGGTEEWKIKEVDEFGYLKLPWYDEEARQDDDDDEEFVEPAQRRLNEALGHQGLGDPDVRFDSHCSPEYTSWLLVTKSVTAYQGHAESLDFEALERERLSQDWDRKLADALTVLGVTPTQEKPGWILCSYTG